MDKVLELIKNKWFRFGVSVISIGYVYFVGLVAWLVFAYYLSPTNSSSLFALYLFINFLFGAVMFFTRKTIITRIVTIIVPFEVFAILICGFGEWYIIVPPLVVAMFAFFASSNGETLKTILGTIFLIMYVVGSLAYITLQAFNITVSYVANGEEIDMTQRDVASYLYSEDSTYRLVKYVEQKESRTTTSYYIEQATQDKHFAFLDCYRVYGCKKILVSVYSTSANPQWISDTELRIDGKVRDIPSYFVKKDNSAAESTTTNKETSILTD